MNDKKDQDNSTELNSSNNSENEKKHKKRRSFSGMIFICALAFVVIYAIINSDSISGFASSVVSVLTPVILGFALAYILNPIYVLFEKSIFKRIKSKAILRALSLVCTYLFATVFTLAVLFLILPELISSLSLFVTKFDAYIDTTIAEINASIAEYFGTHDVPDIIKKEDVLQAVSEFFTESGDLFQAFGSYVIEYGKGLVVGLKNVILALFISIYVLISKERLKAQARKIAVAMLSRKAKKHLYKYVRICDKTFGGFFVGKIIESIIVGVVTLITLMIFDIPYEVLIAAIMCITNIIPVFGPFIGAVPSFFIIFIVDPTKAFIFLALALVIQQLDSNLLAPKILGSSTGLSSLGVIIAVVVMGEWFGVLGMVLGLPIFAVAMTIFNEFIENKLRRKNLPVNSAEYYGENELSEHHGERWTLSKVVFSAAGHLFGKIMKLIFRKSGADNDKKSNKKNKKEDDING